MGLFEVILDFLKSIFSKAEQAEETEKKMLMHEDVFNLMTSSESEATKEHLRKEMAEKDALGVFPYELETDRNIYVINRATHDTYKHLDMTDQYGTQFTTKAKSK